MGFDETEFRKLAKETHDKIIQLGTHHGYLMDKYDELTDKVADFLHKNDIDFNVDVVLEWVYSLDHGERVGDNQYIKWTAFRRFVRLLDEQSKGILNEWKHYSYELPLTLKSEEFSHILEEYKLYLSKNHAKTTVRSYGKCVFNLLDYLEKHDIFSLFGLENSSVSEYLISDRFKNRRSRGIQTEYCILKNFMIFVEKNNLTDNYLLHNVFLKMRTPSERIITTVSDECVAAVLESHDEYITDKRTIAICLIALRLGLRSSDIRNLKFSDIDWENGILKIKQIKTKNEIELPIDAETQNAIIDYVLHERRECDSEYIFIRAVGPTGKMGRHDFKVKYRIKGTTYYDDVAKDGLHIWRRTFASNLLKADVDLPIISKMLGHVDNQSVQRYLSTDEEKMRRCALDLSLIPYETEDENDVQK